MSAALARTPGEVLGSFMYVSDCRALNVRRFAFEFQRNEEIKATTLKSVDTHPTWQ